MIHVGGKVYRSIPACAGEPFSGGATAGPIAVYPRVCGGTIADIVEGEPPGGLSPRVRGTHHSISHSQAIQGLSLRVRGNPAKYRRAPRRARSIPACAGEPTCIPAPTPAPTVYPRVCGGTRPVVVRSGGSGGLSPRVRGNHCIDTARRWKTRSIPACAGEPRAQAISQAPHKVYPRVCGGTSDICIATLSAAGLSPRVRGNRWDVGNYRKSGGSIPACAGEPDWDVPAASANAVYPRVCGGTTGTFSGITAGTGLSPRVRGNPRGPHAVHRRAGSIPACAGEPIALSTRSATSAVYPRVCGGTDGMQAPRTVSTGLSPRVRGNRGMAEQRSAAAGSIPACAGEPLLATPCYGGNGVYPRVCGGTARCLIALGRAHGLSPRVRGNPLTLGSGQG